MDEVARRAASTAFPVQCPAIVLAGGQSRRMNGHDKLAIKIGGEQLLDRAVAAMSPDHVCVVVGPTRQLHRDVVWAREDPPGGGPAAGIAAGLLRLEALDAQLPDGGSRDADALVDGSGDVLVVAGDMPFLADCVQALWSAHVGAAAQASGLAGAGTADDERPPFGQSSWDVTVAVDSDGMDQPLLAVWRRESLREAIDLTGAARGGSVRRLLAGRVIRRVRVDTRASMDCDSPADIESAQRTLGADSQA